MFDDAVSWWMKAICRSAVSLRLQSVNSLSNFCGEFSLLCDDGSKIN